MSLFNLYGERANFCTSRLAGEPGLQKVPASTNLAVPYTPGSEGVPGVFVLCSPPVTILDDALEVTPFCWAIS
eukprot:2047006-Rhodomonas_salina.1